MRRTIIETRQSFITPQKRLLFRLGLVLPRTWKNSLGFFSLGTALVFTVFFGLKSLNSATMASKQILGVATSGLEALQGRDFSTARAKFIHAQQGLQHSQDALVRLAASLPPGKSVDEMLSAAASLSAAGESLTAAAAVLSNSKFIWDSASNSLSRQFYFDLKQARDGFVQASVQMTAAARGFAAASPVFLPGDLAEKLRAGQEQLAAAEQSLTEVVDLVNFILSLLGGPQKTYLLIFQNNNEARATGGFIGTYGLLSVGNGSMKIERIESIYNLDGQLKEQIAAPGPLQYFVSPLWGIRDANWFADFPDASRKILGFLEKETGIAASGVISFTPDVFERLLALTGPVEMPAYGETLTAENFRSRAQYKTSIDYNRAENQPKKMLSDFAPLFLSRLARSGEAGQNQLVDVVEILSRMVAQKHILLFSLDEATQAQIKSYDASGEIKRTDGDYLAIYHSNVGGGKTDQGISQWVEKTVSIDSFGRQTVNLKITRSNQAQNEKFFPKNLDFMRVFVPEGSRILAAEGFDDIDLSASTRPGAATDQDLAFWDAQIARDFTSGIYVGTESGYTTFMDWLALEPGQTRTVTLVYELPFVSPNYSLLLQKQPGARPFDFKLHVKSPEPVVFGNPEIHETVDSDRVYGIVVK